jgi:pyrroloquinoline quinone (PQQ) biosynthesis protein C
MIGNVQKFEQTRNPLVRQRDRRDDKECWGYLNEVIEYILAHRAVEHPFLNKYRELGLPKKAERILYSECFYFFRYLPFYIAGMANQTRDEMVLRELILNVLDEVGNGTTVPTTHSTIYHAFLERLGITLEDIEKYHCLPTTTALNEGIRKLYTESPIIVGLGALYADETMSATMVSKLNEGLKTDGYDEHTRHFWMLHMDAEVGHSNSVFNAIYPYVKDRQTRPVFQSGIDGFLRLVEAYWDGVDALIQNSTGDPRRFDLEARRTSGIDGSWAPCR